MLAFSGLIRIGKWLNRRRDRKSTRLNSSHEWISYAVFCLKKTVERVGVDALLITPSANLRYLCGYDPLPLQRLTLLVIRSDEDPLLVVPELEQRRAAASPP